MQSLGAFLCYDGVSCLLTYHQFCIDPPLDQDPSVDWLCPTCGTKKSLSHLFGSTYSYCYIIYNNTLIVISSTTISS